MTEFGLNAIAINLTICVLAYSIHRLVNEIKRVSWRVESLEIEINRLQDASKANHESILDVNKFSIDRSSETDCYLVSAVSEVLEQVKSIQNTISKEDKA